MIVSHIGIAILASLASGVPSDVNAPINIGGIQTNLGTVLVGIFVVFMFLIGSCFAIDRSKPQGNSGAAVRLFLVFLVVILAIGYRAS